ncbi:ABC transporter permease [Thalassomonas viridans]|uniref:ABC transporter permease n=1 Tax=Thalassomonas viridans TaxID=137584 RepID=A0AAE9ZEX8_9GAMM|nr:ABC transporter permease [Thalassomonas viridans]WDE09188.1 ABC transporter permease [Thalassomonas viridans]
MNFLIDLQYVTNSIFKRLQLSILIVLVMAAGLAFSIYTYTLVSSMLNINLSVANGDRIVSINGAVDAGQQGLYTVDARDFYELRQELQGIEDIGAYALAEQIVSYKTLTLKYRAAYTEWNMFSVTKTEPVLGRGFVPEDNLDGAERIAILSYEIWQRDFAGSNDVLDTKIEVAGAPTRIVGVMPAGYAMPQNTQIWLPLREPWLKPTQRRSGRQVGGFVLLKENVSVDEINKELSLISARYRQLYPKTNDEGLYYYVTSFPKSLWVQNERKGLLNSLYLVTLLVFLLCCINVINLLLSKMNERRKEFAVRLALGSPIYRLGALILLESLILTAIGCGIGVVFALFGLEVTENFLKAYLYNNAPPFWLDLTMAGENLLVILALMFTTAIAISLIPILKAADGKFIDELRDGTRGAQGQKGGLVANILVISQIVLSVLVLICALILISSNYLNAQRDYGVNTEKTLTATVQLPRSYDNLTKVSQYYENFAKEVIAAPNIEGVVVGSRLPGDFPWDGSYDQRFETEGKVYSNPQDRMQGVRAYILPGSLQTLEAKLLEGRFFDNRDAIDGERSVILTKSLANRLWPDESAIGKRVKLGSWSAMDWMTEEHMPWMTVVGVTGDIYNSNPFGFYNADRGTAYIPLTQRTIWSSRVMEIAVKYTGSLNEAMTVLDTIRERLDPSVGIYEIDTFEQRIYKNGVMHDAIGDLFLFCGFIALLLASVGIYGVIANMIIQRRHEIGVRRALGATDSIIIMFFLKKNMMNLLISLPLGIVGAVYLKQLIAKSISIHADAGVLGFILVPVIVFLVSVGATYIPTRKAVELLPSDALREN